MEQSRKDESELEEGEISEDAEELKRNLKGHEGTSSTDFRNTISSSVKTLNRATEIATDTPVKTFQSRMTFPRRGRNSFVGRVYASGFFRKKEFTSVTRPGIGLYSNLQKPRYDAKIKGAMSRRNYMPRLSATPSGFRNVQRSVFCLNVNQKPDNMDKFIDADNDTSYEELLEQYRQIKCRLHDLSEEETKQLKNGDKSNKSYDLKLGNNKENWQLKQCQTKKGKSTTVNSSVDHADIHKGRRNYLPRTTPIRRRRRTYECHKQSKKSKISQEKHKQKQHRKESNKSSNDDEDLLELRKQALATLSKQSSCNKIKETCAEIQFDSNDTPVDECTQNQNTAIFNVLGDNYEEVAMDLDSDGCPDSPEETSENKNTTEDPQIGDEIDEEELRKQLLESIAGKKRQREQMERHEENEFLQPLVDEVFPPDPPVRNTANSDDIPKTVKCSVVATAEPLVINLAEDSSSEEELEKHQISASVSTPVPEVLPPGLEQLIKDARMQSEKRQASAAVVNGTPAAVQKLSKAQQQEYRKLKEEIAKRESVLKVENKDVCNDSTSDTEKLDAKIIIAKSEINREQERLQNLRIQLCRKKFVARNSQAKVQKLKEQLAAAEMELVLDMQMIKISNAKIKEIQLSLHKKVLSFQALQKKYLQENSHAHGIDKIPKLQVNGTAKQKSINKLVVEKRNPITVVSNTPKAKMTPAEIVTERERLQKLEKEVALQLEELRKKSRKTLPGKKPVNTKAVLRTSTHNYKRKFTSSLNVLSRPNTRNVKKVKLDAPIPVLSRELSENNFGRKTGGKLQSVPIDTVATGAKKRSCVVLTNGSLERTTDYRGTSELLDHYARLPVLLYTYQLCDIFWPRLEKLELDDLYEDTKFLTSSSDVISSYSYTSPLLHVRSYRLHPHFVSQEQQFLSSNTYANGLDVKRGLCRFDLLGTCNDDKCTWQHQAHYKLSNEEIVADLLAYAPAVSGIVAADDAQQSEVKLLKASRKLLEENSSLPLEDVCKEAVSKVNLSLNSMTPNFVALTKRSWKPYTKKPMSGSPEEWEVSNHLKELKCREVSHEDCDFDNLITDADKRYYTSEEKIINRLEEVVAENEGDIQLWLKLAYKHLQSSESSELCLEQSLNVLSRALESNQDNPELWKNYLSLYAKHPASKDVISVCQEALQWCPQYEIWWKYLQLSEGYKNKYDICSSFLENLMSSKMQQYYDNESLSHYILEVILYQVQLSLQVGKYENAIVTFKERLKKKVCDAVENREVCNHKDSLLDPISADGIVRSNEKENVKIDEKCSGNVNSVNGIGYKVATEKAKQCRDLKLPVEFMTISDYCFAWLCYIYVTEFKCLPDVIFQNGEDRLGHVTSKNPFLIDWTQCHRLLNSKDAIKEILAQAACCCMSERAESVDACFPIYFQIVTIELSTKNYALAVEVCEKLLQISSTNVSVWLLLARIYAYQSLEEEVIEVLMKAMVFVPYNPCICYVTSLYQFSKGNIVIAKEILENFAQGFFLEPDSVPTNIFHYTELLYCKLLHYDTVRMDYLPKRNDIVISEEIKVYLWLNYILYLLCNGSSHSVILMTFEAALASFHIPAAMKIIWWQYLQFSIRYISKGNNFKDILRLLNECKVVIPTNICLHRLSGKFRNDFGFHMTVVDFFLHNIASHNDKAVAAEKFLKILPRNTALIQRAVHYYLGCDKEDMALSLLEDLPHMEVFSSYLWRLAIRLILNARDRQEVHRFYTQSVQVLPYNHILWLEYLMYEVSENHHEHIERIKKECCQLQIDGIHS